MRRRAAWWALVLLLAAAPGVRAAEVQVARDGRTPFVILLQPGATAVDKHAADELARFLEKVTQAHFPICQAGADLPKHALVIGAGPVAARLFPKVDLTSCNEDEVVICASERHLLLAGGRPRGTLYAVYRFLHHECGCRWWAPWASTIPTRTSLAVPCGQRREKPAFRWRDTSWLPAKPADWAARNYLNGASVDSTEQTGGNARYAGFVHTYYHLVPPQTHFGLHPEWFSLVNGRRVDKNAQLCLSNEELRTFLAEQVRARLRQTPGVNFVSVSQNDHGGHCECPNCQRLSRSEGSPAATVLDGANYVAERIAADHPQVLVDTLAYAGTRKPPRTLKARANVVVRLCSIECDFARPLDHPVNAAFLEDLKGWRQRCEHLHIWDYTTNFAHFQLPHPDWFVLGPNLRVFQRFGVSSVFEQGVHQTHGAEMAELRAWLIAQLLWNPQQDDQALLDEFLKGYYGASAAPFIRSYLELMQQATGAYRLSCYNDPQRSPFLTLVPLSKAEHLWDEAEKATRNDPEKLWRVRQGRAPVRYAWLVRWPALRREARAAGLAWPLANSRKAAAAQWLQWVSGEGPPRWSRLKCLEEYPGAITPPDVVRYLAVAETGAEGEADPHEVSEPGWLANAGNWCLAWLAPPLGLLGLSAALLAVVLSVALRRGRRFARWRWALLLASVVAFGFAISVYGWLAAELTTRPLATVSGLALLSAGCSICVLYSAWRQVWPRGARIMLASTAVLAGLYAWYAYPFLCLRLGLAHGRDYRGANFCGAVLPTAVLDRAVLPGACLERASLAGSWISFANFTGANLRSADLRGCSLMYTSLRGADLRGADLRGAHFCDLTYTSLTGAFYDAATRWPDGFHPEDWELIRAP